MYTITDKETDEILYIIRDDVSIPDDGIAMTEIQELREDGEYRPSLIGGGDIKLSKVNKRGLAGRNTPDDLKDVRKYKFNGTDFSISEKYADYKKERDELGKLTKINGGVNKI